MIGLFRTPSQMEDLALFTRHVAGAMKAKAPLPDILRAYATEADAGRLGDALGAVADKVESGLDLSAALEGYPRLFPLAYRRLVRLGEQGRTLADVMDQLAGSLEEGLKTYEYFRRAAIYPAFILILLFLDAAFIAIRILPKFTAIFTQLGAELPGTTMALVNGMGGLGMIWIFALVLLLPTAFLIATVSGLRLRWLSYGRWQLNMPLVGPVLRRAETSRFARNLALLLRNRIPLAEGLGLLADASENAYVRSAIEEFQGRFEAGERLSDLVAAQPLFPPSMAVVIASAEDQGGLADTLDELGKFYGERTSHGLTVLREVFEPLLILLIGLLVAFMMVALYAPLFDLPSLIR